MKQLQIDLREKAPDELKWLAGAAELLDNRFKIPGTNVRFGFDSLIGLIPYAGDVITFVVGGMLIIIMYRKGASGKLTGKMVMNLWVDGAIGTIPLLGDIFDFRYRSNLKNVNLMMDYYEEGKHRGSAWGMVIILLIVLIVLISLSLYVIWKTLEWILI